MDERMRVYRVLGTASCYVAADIAVLLRAARAYLDDFSARNLAELRRVVERVGVDPARCPRTVADGPHRRCDHCPPREPAPPGRTYEDGELRRAYRFIYERPSKNHIDHACAQCVPGGSMVVDGFVCVPHLAAADALLSSAPPVEPREPSAGGVLTATPWPDAKDERKAWLARAFCSAGHGPNAPACPECREPEPREPSVPVSALKEALAGRAWGDLEAKIAGFIAAAEQDTERETSGGE